MVKRWDFDRTIKCSSFIMPEGAEEYYFTFTNNEARSFHKAIAGLCEKYQFVTKYLGLSEQTLVFSRLHVSDIFNQKNLLLKSELFRHIGHGVVSVIEQTPLTPDSLVLFSYHLRRKQGSFKRNFLTTGAYRGAPEWSLRAIITRWCGVPTWQKEDFLIQSSRQN